MIRSLPVLALLGVALALPSAAGASTAAVTGPQTITIAAAAGEANAITTVESGSRREITDNAGITAGAGCEQVSATEVLCTMPDIHLFTIVDLGDGNDSYFDADTIAKDDVNGGAGNDDIYVGLSDDIVRGDEGDDKLEAGSGDDQIDGRDGNDRVIGHSGNDTLYGGRGEDTISGDNTDLSNGDDVIEAVDGQKDLVACGGGTDRVNADDIDVIEEGLCDDVNLTSTGGGGDGGGGGGDDGAARVDVETPASLKLRKFLKKGLSFTATFSEPVVFAAALFVPKKAARKFGLGKKAVVIASGGGRAGEGTFPARLTKLSKKKKLRALLERKGFEKLPVVFQALATDADGNETTVKQKLKLTG